MAATPTCTVRALPNHHPLLRAVAARLRADAGFGEALSAFLAGLEGEAVPAAPVVDASANILARLADLERRMVEMEARNTTVSQPAGSVLQGDTVAPAEIEMMPAAALVAVKAVPAEAGRPAAEPLAPADQRHDDAAAAPAGEVEPVQDKDEPPLFSLPPAPAMVEPLTFGDHLQAARKGAGMSRPALGKAMNVTGEMVRRFEVGLSAPTPERRRQLVALFPVLTGG